MESRVSSVPAVRRVTASHDEVGQQDELLTPRNFFPFKKHLLRVCLRKHGELGRIIADGTMPDIPMPGPPELLVEAPAARSLRGTAEPVLTLEQEAAKIEYLEQVKLTVGRRSEMAREMTRMFGALLGSIGEESMMRLEGHPEWDITSTSYDPVRLWALMKSTHIGSATGIKSEDRSTARRQYEELRQGKTEPVSAFCQAFVHAVARLSEVKVDLPQEDQAADFLAKLDEARFGSLRSEIRSAAVRGIKEAPATLSDAMRITVAWAGHDDDGKVEGSSIAAAKSSPPEEAGEHKVSDEATSTSVFMGKKSVPKGRCKICKELGHYMADCSYLDEFAEYVEEKKGMANAKVHFTTTKPLDAIF